MKVAALTSGKDTPSTRYRVRQHIPFLEKGGIKVREIVPILDKYAGAPIKGNSPLIRGGWKCLKVAAGLPGFFGSGNCDLIWLEREMNPGLLTYEPFFKKPFVFDVDDAIWLTPPFGEKSVANIARRAAVVLAGNSHIANWMAPYAKRITIIPTAVETEGITVRNHEPGKVFVAGWIGTSGNYPYLYHIQKALGSFLRSHKARLLIVSDRKPEFDNVPSNKVNFIRWSRETEKLFFQKADVGLMPLLPDEWCLGKCSFKMLQYMAAGIPVIASPVGMNETVLSLGEAGFSAHRQEQWSDALSALYNDPSLGVRFGRSGREFVE